MPAPSTRRSASAEGTTKIAAKAAAKAEPIVFDGVDEDEDDEDYDDDDSDEDDGPGLAFLIRDVRP